jgi:hypothetical protein
MPAVEQVSTPLRLASRAVLATGRGPGRALWTAAGKGLARVAGSRAAAGVPGASVYTRGGLGRGDFVPGLSDVDVIVVTPDGAGRGTEAERVRARWRRAEARHPSVYAIFGEPRIHDEAELADLVAASAYTYGLGDGADRAAFSPDPSLRDRLRLLDKPGLVGATDDWVLLSGPDRRPSPPPRTAQEERIAAWLELAFYWRHAVPACLRAGPRTPLLCVKLVAEPARILLRLTAGARLASRSEVLRRALEAFPDEAPAFRLALETEQALPRRAPAPLAESVAALARLSRRIAEIVSRDAFAAGGDLVQLDGAGADPGAIPLCDWRAVVSPTHRSETVRAGDGSPGDLASLRAAALRQDGGAYTALREGALLVLPSPVRERNRLRAVQCAASDPVTFALLEGRRQAIFPRAEGWSIEHVARRAVAEHRARLATPLPDAVTVLGAARAALLWESVRRGAPTLAVTAAAAWDALDGDVDGGALDEARAGAASDGALETLARDLRRRAPYAPDAR